MSETFWMDNEGRIGGTDDGEPFIQNRTPQMFAEWRDDFVLILEFTPEEVNHLTEMLYQVRAGRLRGEHHRDFAVELLHEIGKHSYD